VAFNYYYHYNNYYLLQEVLQDVSKMGLGCCIDTVIRFAGNQVDRDGVDD